MNIQKLMKQAQQMQEKLMREQGDTVVEAIVGGGMVKVKMNGHKQLIAVSIDPEVLDPDDPGMVSDLVIAAVNEAGRMVDEELQQKLGGLAGGVPGLF
jgi:DNA-binding YbaB/EbfC family protein